MLAFFRWPVTLAYAGLIFYLSVIPSIGGPVFEYRDKLMHASAYGGLAFLCLWSLLASFDGKKLVSLVLTAVVLATVYGIFNEVVQSYISTRSAEFLDAVADAVGAVLGVLSYIWIRSWRKNDTSVR